jgi:hypothetical protein
MKDSKENKSNIDEMIAEAMEGEKTRKPVALFITLFVLTLIIVVMAIFLFKGKGKGKTSFNTPKLNQMQEMVGKIKVLESELQEKQNEIFEAIKGYKEKTGQDLPTVNVLNLSPEEKKILEKKIAEEQNVSIKSLIRDLLNKNEDISVLTNKIGEIEELLPAPSLVQEGQNHYLISMNYLVNKKNVSKKKAQELVERSMLYDTLLPGFKIWNFYSGDEFGTFITQGDADVSPNTVRRKVKKRLIDAKDKAIAEKEELANEIKILRDKKDKIIVELNILNDEKKKLLSKLNDLSRKKSDFQLRLNSLFYIVDTENNLKKKGILKGGFLASVKLNDISPSHFDQSIDLRKSKSIVLSTRFLKIDKITKVRIYPKFYKLGEDYRVKYTKSGKTVIVSLLSIEKMKNERAVVSIN